MKSTCFRTALKSGLSRTPTNSVIALPESYFFMTLVFSFRIIIISPKWIANLMLDN